MEYELLGWPADGPTLELDWKRFAYAGKFVVGSTGKAVARENGSVIAALAFDEDRTDADRLVFRYVTVRRDRRGEGVGSALLAFGRERARERGYDRCRISVNNPYAFEAAYRAGFGYTGETTGMAELVLEWPADRSAAAYRSGFRVFADRDLDEDAARFVRRKTEGDPPVVLDPPASVD